jgi:N-acyl-D-amino-acid deacylase
VIALALAAALLAPPVAGVGSVRGAGRRAANLGDPAFPAIDAAMTAYMANHGIFAASFAMAGPGGLVYSQGYGTMTRGGSIPVPANALFRLASVTKPMTAAEVQYLVAQGKMATTDHAFCLGEPGPCRLAIPLPPGKTSYDPRLRAVTVQMILDHTGGWDRSISGDPVFESLAIAHALGIASPPGSFDIARYMMGQPLDHDPGTTYAYSNFGYMLLGLMIENLTGEPFATAIVNDIFHAGSGGTTDVELGRTLPAERSAREPAYNCDGDAVAPSVFDPSKSVCLPDGAFDLEAIGGAGALIASAPAVGWFLTHYNLDGTPRTYPPSGLGYVWIFGPGVFEGSLPGTRAFAAQMCSGFNFVILVNQRFDSTYGYSYSDGLQTVEQAAAVYATEHPIYPAYTGDPACQTTEEEFDLQLTESPSGGQLV